jgi:hemerythrin
MEPLLWTDDIKVGIKEIDQQHKQFVDLVNKIANNNLTIHSELLSVIFGELIEYAQVHFATEEAILEKYDFPNIEQHKKSHLELTESISNILLEGMNHDIHTIDDLHELVKKWVSEHLLNEDMSYRQYFIDKGIVQL